MKNNVLYVCLLLSVIALLLGIFTDSSFNYDISLNLFKILYAIDCSLLIIFLQDTI